MRGAFLRAAEGVESADDHREEPRPAATAFRPTQHCRSESPGLLLLPQSGSGVTVAPLPPALLLLVQDAAARTTGRGRFVTLLRVPRAPLAASTRGGGGS